MVKYTSTNHTLKPPKFQPANISAFTVLLLGQGEGIWFVTFMCSKTNPVYQTQIKNSWKNFLSGFCIVLWVITFYAHISTSGFVLKTDCNKSIICVCNVHIWTDCSIVSGFQELFAVMFLPCERAYPECNLMGSSFSSSSWLLCFLGEALALDLALVCTPSVTTSVSGGSTWMPKSMV